MRALYFCRLRMLVDLARSSASAKAMSSALSQLNCESLVRSRVEAGVTHAAIAVELQQLHPGARGLSTRSVRRYCSDNGIHYSSRLNQEQVDQLVERAVFQV